MTYTRLDRELPERLSRSWTFVPNQRLLEVGCGTGGTMVRVAQHKPVHIDGVDVMPSMLAVARKRLHLAGLSKRSSVRLLREGERLPFAGASYDAAYSESVLGFQDEAAVKAILAEVFRVLKPGGRYVANEAIWRDRGERGTCGSGERGVPG